MTIEAVAIDRNNRPVLDLTKDELEVWIGSYRVPIESLEVVTPASETSGGRLIVLLLDDVILPLQLVPRAREAAKRFVNRMGPDDEMAVVMLSGGGMEPTSARAALLRRLDTYNVRPTSLMRFDELGAHVLTTIDALARQLAEAPDRRGTIVGIGVSWVFDRPIPPPSIARDLRQEWTAAMRTLALARANFYVIEPAGVGMSPPGAGSGGFAEATGGHLFVNTNDLTGAADQIMRETANYYRLTVGDPPVGRKADLRELDVRARRGGVSIRAREWLPGR